jgi:hypothetical protein
LLKALYIKAESLVIFFENIAVINKSTMLRSWLKGQIFYIYTCHVALVFFCLILVGKKSIQKIKLINNCACIIQEQDAMTQMGSLDEAAAYIKKLKERVEELQQRRSAAQLMAAGMVGGGSAASTSAATTTVMSGGGGARSEEAAGEEAVEAPVVEVLHRDHDGSSLDVVLISGVERPFKLHEVVTVLEEEGAEIVNANLSVADRKVFHTIHCRVRFSNDFFFICACVSICWCQITGTEVSRPWQMHIVRIN